MRKPPSTKSIIVFGLLFVAIFMTIVIGKAKCTETADRPAQDLVYVAVINGFKVPIIIPKGSLNPEHRGKIWETKDQYDADWEQAMKWKDEILEEEANE